MKLKVIVVALATLMLGACKGKVGVELYAEITPVESSTPPVQLVRPVAQPAQASVEIITSTKAASTATASRASTSVRRRQVSVTKPASDCADPCLRFQTEQTVPIGN